MLVIKSPYHLIYVHYIVPSLFWTLKWRLICNHINRRVSCCLTTTKKYSNSSYYIIITLEFLLFNNLMFYLHIIICVVKSLQIKIHVMHLVYEALYHSYHIAHMYTCILIKLITITIRK